MRCFVGFVFVLVLSVLPWMGCGDDVPEACRSFCAQDAKCYGSEGIPNCVQYCDDLLAEAASVSDECATLFAEMAACVGELPSCDDVNAYYSEDPPDSYPCKAEEDAVREKNCV